MVDSRLTERIEERVVSPVAFLEPAEFEFKPENLFWRVIAQNGFRLRFKSVTADLYGRPTSEKIGVYIDDLQAKEKVMAIKELVEATENFQDLVRRASRGAFRPKETQKQIKASINGIFGKHPELAP